MRIHAVSPAEVTAELERYLAASARQSRPETDWAARHDVLPLAGDLGGCWALTRDAELVFFGWDAPEELEVVEGLPHEAAVMNAALTQGSERYPRLAAMRPVRPPDAVPCTTCDGSGRIPDTPDNVICLCAGLGWLPPDRTKGIRTHNQRLSPATGRVMGLLLLIAGLGAVFALAMEWRDSLGSMHSGGLEGFLLIGGLISMVAITQGYRLATARRGASVRLASWAVMTGAGVMLLMGTIGVVMALQDSGSASLLLGSGALGFGGALGAWRLYRQRR